MRVVVKFFAVLKDRAGTDGFSAEVPEGSRVSDVRAFIVRKYPDLEKHLARTAFAVNREYVREDAVLHDNDELAAIPPVSGG